MCLPRPGAEVKTHDELEQEQQNVHGILTINRSRTISAVSCLFFQVAVCCKWLGRLGAGILRGIPVTRGFRTPLPHPILSFGSSLYALENYHHLSRDLQDGQHVRFAILT